MKKMICALAVVACNLTPTAHATVLDHAYTFNFGDRISGVFRGDLVEDYMRNVSSFTTSQYYALGLCAMEGGIKDNEALISSTQSLNRLVLLDTPDVDYQLEVLNERSVFLFDGNLSTGPFGIVAQYALRPERTTTELFPRHAGNWFGH